ncbi:hypothetical protein MPER_10310, partial [Moniliophthora perniciosa FA553]
GRVKAKKNPVNRVIFGEEARHRGFHKRKVAKAEASQKKAAERGKKERLESGREQRRILKEQATENAAQVESAYGAIIFAIKLEKLKLPKFKAQKSDVFQVGDHSKDTDHQYRQHHYRIVKVKLGRFTVRLGKKRTTAREVGTTCIV